MTAAAPYEVGQLVRPHELYGWTYTGLQGKPGAAESVRRYVKGDWVLQVRAHSDPRRNAAVVSIRTCAQDSQWWSVERTRLRQFTHRVK
ncbi:MAG TPA: hypothetical protein VFG38_00090 [Pseudomonadales bacterium]|nr:hypothetical protein [Pseudomonadales bacterium]